MREREQIEKGDVLLLGEEDEEEKEEEDGEETSSENIVHNSIMCPLQCEHMFPSLRHKTKKSEQESVLENC